MEEQQPRRDDPATTHAALLDEAATLMLGTTTDDGLPHVSYAPFVRTGSAEFCIYISQLALHTRNLLARPVASALIIADEAQARQPFARVRAHYFCEVTEIARQSADHGTILAQFRERHGKMIELLQQLADFHLFRLQASSGQFVQGFGKAYKLTGAALDQFEHTRTG